MCGMSRSIRAISSSSNGGRSSPRWTPISEERPPSLNRLPASVSVSPIGRKNSLKKGRALRSCSVKTRSEVEAVPVARREKNKGAGSIATNCSM